MSGIHFVKEIREAKVLNPFLGFEVDVQPIEFRLDPLTKRSCRINVKRSKRMKQTRDKKDGGLSEIVEGSRKDCFFCPENLEKSTPRFPVDLFPQGRLRSGSAWLFPNLFPFDEYHAITTFSEAHFLDLDGFEKELIRNSVKISVDFIRTIHEKHPGMRYPIISWNHLPPAGASFIHPHLQTLLSREATHQLEELIKSGEEYYKRMGRSYWSDLIATEKEIGERLIGESGSVTWLASYAPQGNNEVMGILAGTSTISMLSESQIEDIADGLSRVLKAYHRIGVESFNMTTFSTAMDQDLNHFSLSVKLITRPNPRSFYTSDGGFMERLHHEAVIQTLPEEVAENMRTYFTEDP